MPELSVLMPMRDAASTVHLAVRSTLRAMPDDSELVIFDDGSRDASAEVVASISDRRLRLITGTESRGVAGALNHLLGQIDSELVARMDADDICLPWRFRSQLRALASDRSDVVFGGVTHFGERLRRLRVHPPIGISVDAMPFHLVLGNPVCHSTMLAGTRHLREVGGYRPVATEDYDLWLRLAARGTRLSRTAAPVVLYRVHPGQVTASQSWKDRPPLEPALEESYTLLCRRILDEDPVWFPNPRRNAQSPAVLGRMAEAVEERSRRLPAHQQRMLMHKVRVALRHADSSLVGPAE